MAPLTPFKAFDVMTFRRIKQRKTLKMESMYVNIHFSIESTVVKTPLKNEFYAKFSCHTYPLQYKYKHVRPCREIRIENQIVNKFMYSHS